jgi:hypothetical protein
VRSSFSFPFAVWWAVAKDEKILGPVLRYTRMAEILPYLFITNGMIVIIKLYKALYKPV